MREMKLFRPEKAQGDLNNEFKGGNEDVARLSPVLSALKKKGGGEGGGGRGHKLNTGNSI